MLQDEINKRIKEEISNDPEKIGYAGKSDEEIQVLLNTPVVKERIVYDQSAPPISRILSGLANAANIVQVKEVTDAKASKEVIE